MMFFQHKRYTFTRWGGKRKVKSIAVYLLMLVALLCGGLMSPTSSYAAGTPVTVTGTAVCVLQLLNQACDSVTLAVPGYFKTIALGPGKFNFTFTGVPRDQAGKFTFDAAGLKCPVYDVKTSPAWWAGDTVDVGGQLCVPSNYPTTKLRLSVTLRDPLNGQSINTRPQHPQRPITVQIYDASGLLFLNQQSIATYNASTDSYNATLDLGRVWPTGYYQIKTKLDYTLRKLVQGISTITNSQDNLLPQVNLTAGDVNQDNALTTTDYTTIQGCYSDLAPPVNCDATRKRASDINDDGNVNQYDINLWMRIYSTYPGGA